MAVVARLALLFVPFPKLARRLGAFVPPDDPRALRARERAAAEQMRTAEEIGWAVTRAARHVPFKAVCLPQAMAARAMHFVTAKGETKPLDAPAWLDAAGVEVCFV